MQQNVFGRFLVVVGVVIVALYYVFPSVQLIHYKITAPDVGETADKAIALYNDIETKREALGGNEVDPDEKRRLQEAIALTSQSLTALLEEVGLHFTAIDEAARGKGFEDSATTVPTARIRRTIVKGHRAQLLELETRAMPLGAVPIRFGLDLEGGTDITIALDRERTIRERLRELKAQILGEMNRENIGATIEVLAKEESLALTLTNPEDHRAARDILDEFDIFESWNAAQLEQGRRVLLKLDQDTINRTKRDAIDSALKVIRRRVDVQGLVMPVVVKQGEDRIRVQMPGVDDPEAVVRNIIKPAQLEFRILHESSEETVQSLFEPEAYQEVCAYIEKNKKLPDPLPLKDGAEVPTGYVLRPGEYTQRDEDERPVTRYMPYLVDEDVELTGARLSRAYVDYNQSSLSSSPYEIGLVFDKQGAIEFREITKRHLGKRMAILLDDYLYSAPVLRVVIGGGRARIEGDFTANEARDLALVLKAGALPAQLTTEDTYVVEATLGLDSIRKGINALAIGGVAVIIFMILYYGTSGFIAVIALTINVLCVAAILCLSRATLTLSGIGGILLTIGMAVDANVLIYERIREEMATSRGLKAAVAKGFGRAFTVIFDSNLTTLITALTLLQFGTGSVQGFALTMTFGIFATLFTGLFVTHVLTDLWIQRRNRLSIGKFRIFRDPKINFIRLRYFGYTVSAALLIAGIGTMVFRSGPQFGVEFTGGVMTDVTFAQETSEDEIKGALSPYFAATPIVQRVRGENRYILRIQAVAEGGEDLTEAERLNRTKEKLTTALRAYYKPLDNGREVATVGQSRAITGQVGREFVRMAIIAIFIASIGILVYLWFRFELVFGAGALTALFHDILITLGVITMCGQEISLDVVAALLIVVGYSVNDTIVIYDRIRETIRTTYGKSYPDMLNLSINQSLNRTTVTSLSTLFVTLVMLLLGGPGLRGFALVLTIGVIVGTYSSSFIATPVLYEYHEHRRRRQEQHA